MYKPECSYTVCDIRQWDEGAFRPCVITTQSRHANQLHNGCTRQPHGVVCSSPREVSGCKITNFPSVTKYFFSDNQHFNIFRPDFSHSAAGLSKDVSEWEECCKTALYRGVPVHSPSVNECCKQMCFGFSSRLYVKMNFNTLKAAFKGVNRGEWRRLAAFLR